MLQRPNFPSKTLHTNIFKFFHAYEIYSQYRNYLHTLLALEQGNITRTLKDFLASLQFTEKCFVAVWFWFIVCFGFFRGSCVWVLFGWIGGGAVSFLFVCFYFLFILVATQKTLTKPNINITLSQPHSTHTFLF